MSDLGRKDFSSKVSDSMTPNSSKSTVDKVGDTFSGAGDKIAREAVPDSQKSTTQKVSDKFGREKDNTAHGGTGESIVDKTKNAFGLGDKK
jgi:molybdopterin biosynthesis enzyme MoaB